MNLRTVNSNNYPMEFLQDLVEAKRIEKICGFQTF